MTSLAPPAPVRRVWCDRCGTMGPVLTSVRTPDGQRFFKLPDGWDRNPDGDDLCPSCLQKDHP